MSITTDCVAARMCMHPRTSFALQVARVRERVDRAVQANALFDARIEARKVPPLHRIGHEIAHRHQRVGAREVEVAEVVHARVGGCGDALRNGSMINPQCSMINGCWCELPRTRFPVLGVQGTLRPHRPPTACVIAFVGLVPSDTFAM